MKQLAFLLLSVLMLLAVTACCEKKTVPKTQPIENTQNSLTEETSDERTETGACLHGFIATVSREARTVSKARDLITKKTATTK